MAITEKIRGIVDFLTQGIEQRDDVFDDIMEDSEEYMTENNLALAPSPASSYSSKNDRHNDLKVVSHPGFKGGYEVVIVEPRSFGEAGSIVQNLIDRKTVVLNLHLLDKEQSQRTIDFVCGAAHALSGKPQKVGDMVFVFTPSNVTMSVDASANQSKFADSLWGKAL